MTSLLIALCIRYKRRTVLRVVYVHRISDNRLDESSLQPLRMLASFLRYHRVGSVVLTTTMWHNPINQEKANDRHNELCIEYWRGMTDNGCQIAKFGKTLESAWTIIDMTKNTSDAIHDFLLEGEDPSESINSYGSEPAPSRKKKTLLERCKVNPRSGNLTSWKYSRNFSDS